MTDTTLQELLDVRDAIQPHHLDSWAALMAAAKTKMCKQKGEKDTEFVKRIVAAYLNADAAVKLAEAADDLQALISSAVLEGEK